MKNLQIVKMGEEILAIVKVKDKDKVFVFTDSAEVKTLNQTYTISDEEKRELTSQVISVNGLAHWEHKLFMSLVNNKNSYCYFNDGER